jgi:hypothetical protein
MLPATWHVQMKKLLFAIAVIGVIYVVLGGNHGLRDFAEPHQDRPVGVAIDKTDANGAIRSAFNGRRSGIRVSGEGIVSKLLPDDNDGGRHQRFILTLSSGQTLLVAHNIDIAPRVETLREGDSVAFKGVYEWNAKGGVIHWTHRDPGGKHEAGWVKHAGRTYE